MNIKYLNAECELISKSCDLEFGKNAMPLSDENNLLYNNKALDINGFGKFTLNNQHAIDALERIVSEHIINELGKLQSVPEIFSLKKYHSYLESEKNHYKISTWALDYTVLGNLFFEVKQQMEDLLQLKLSIKRINHLGIDGEYVGFRILRPMKNDHNPFHRDSWIPYWRDTINIWLPICGFENANSLQFIAKSHKWLDDQILKTKSGVEIDGKKYHVPAAIGTVNNFSIETPLLKSGEGIIFSPYLIHGNGVNRNKDITRVSVEFRFCKESRN